MPDRDDMLFTYTHGLTHGPPGAPPHLRLSVHGSGLVVLTQASAPDQEERIAAVELTPAHVAQLRQLIQPDRFDNMGSSAGYGPSWSIFDWRAAEPANRMTWHFTSEPGSLDATTFTTVAAAIAPLLAAFTALIRTMREAAEGAADGGEGRAVHAWSRTLSRLLAGPAKRQPVERHSPHGTLLLRYNQFDASDPDGGTRDIWMKIYDSGVVEHRIEAHEIREGIPSPAPLVSLPPEDVHTMLELLDRASIGQWLGTGDCVAQWERYDAEQVRRSRVYFDEREGSKLFPADGEQREIIETLHAMCSRVFDSRRE